MRSDTAAKQSATPNAMKSPSRPRISAPREAVHGERERPAKTTQAADRSAADAGSTQGTDGEAAASTAAVRPETTPPPASRPLLRSSPASPAGDGSSSRAARDRPRKRTRAAVAVSAPATQRATSSVTCAPVNILLPVLYELFARILDRRWRRLGHGLPACFSPECDEASRQAREDP